MAVREPGAKPTLARVASRVRTSGKRGPGVAGVADVPLDVELDPVDRAVGATGPEDPGHGPSARRRRPPGRSRPGPPGGPSRPRPRSRSGPGRRPAGSGRPGRPSTGDGRLPRPRARGREARRRRGRGARCRRDAGGGRPSGREPARHLLHDRTGARRGPAYRGRSPESPARAGGRAPTGCCRTGALVNLVGVESKTCDGRDSRREGSRPAPGRQPEKGRFAGSAARGRRFDDRMDPIGPAHGRCSTGKIPPATREQKVCRTPADFPPDRRRTTRTPRQTNPRTRSGIDRTRTEELFRAMIAPVTPTKRTRGPI